MIRVAKIREPCLASRETGVSQRTQRKQRTQSRFIFFLCVLCLLCVLCDTPVSLFSFLIPDTGYLEAKEFSQKNTTHPLNTQFIHSPLSQKIKLENICNRNANDAS